MHVSFRIKTTYLALPTRNKHWNVFLCRPLVADSANGQRWWWTYWPYIACLRRSFSKEPPFTGFLTAFYGDFFGKKKKNHFNIKWWHFHKQCNCGTVYLQGPLLKYIWQVRLIFFSFNSAKLKKKREMCRGITPKCWHYVTLTWPALVAAPLSDVWHVNTLGPSRANQLPRNTHTFC